MKQDLTARINQAWNSRSMKVDWMGLENLLVDILVAEDCTDSERVKLSREAIDAYTRRGHFLFGKDMYFQPMRHK